jgi:hypothetical protein
MFYCRLKQNYNYTKVKFIDSGHKGFAENRDRSLNFIILVTQQNR